VLTGAVERAAYAEELPDDAKVAEIAERSERLARELEER
jgi:hypothetical protein